MRKSYLNMLLIFFLFWCGCQEDDNVVTASHYSQQFIGKWEYVGGNSFDQYLKYLIINPDNYYYFLYNLEGYRHEIYDGVYSITGNQVYLNGLFIFSIQNDTLTLTRTDYSMTFVRNNNAPSETEWLIPVTIEKEIPLADSIRMGDITFDGSCFWSSGGSGIILKIDTLGNLITSLPVWNSGGITYSEGTLWIASHDTLKKLNPLTGQIIGQQKIQGNYELYSLAYGDGYIWAGTYEGVYIKIQGETGEIIDSLAIYLNGGLEFQYAQLWIANQKKIYSVETDSGKIIDTYRLPNESGYSSGLAYDGTTFWRVIYRYDQVGYSIQKLNLPL